MTLYEYQDQETGELVEIEAPMTDPPEFELEQDGRRLRRVFSRPQLAVPDLTNGHQRYADGSPIGDRGLGRNFPFAEHRDKLGRPLFRTNAERLEAHARMAHSGAMLDARELSQPGTPERGRMFYDR